MDGIGTARDLVLSRVESDAVAIITLADPASGNALGEAMVERLAQAIEAAGRRDDVHAIVLAGEGEVFSAGAPRDLLERLARGEVAPADIRLPQRLLDCPVPIVAAMAGHATGGGFALGLAADIVLIARESRYGFPFMNMGFTPGMGITRLSEHVLGRAVAHELLFTGELRKGAELAATGAFNHALAAADVLPKALDIARRIAAKPRRALELLKRTLSLPRRRALVDALTLETLMHEVTFAGRDAIDLIKDGYVE